MDNPAWLPWNVRLGLVTRGKRLRKLMAAELYKANHAYTKFTDLDQDVADLDRHRSSHSSSDSAGAEDRAYRRAYGGLTGMPFNRPLRSAYAIIIGESPVCGPGDRDKAKDYLTKIEQAIEQGGWSNAERTRLYRLRDKWRARAEGRDARFNVAGTRPGRLGGEIEGRVRGLVKRELARSKVKVQARSRSRRDVDWSQFDYIDVDLDLPPGRARGGPEGHHGADLEGDAGDDETGEKYENKRAVMSDRDFIVPGQDQKGHSHRVQCRVMPAHYRALTAIYQSKVFPFRTLGDVARWCVDNGIRELGRLGKVRTIESLSGQVDAIREILLDEQFYQDYAGTFEGLVAAVNRHQAAQAVGEARRVVALVKKELERMPEGYWRGRYLDELKRQFGHLLDGNTTEGVRLVG